MSSPISENKKDNAVGRTIINAHRKLSHSNRLEILASALAKSIQRNHSSEETIKCLDVGCGDMGLAELISNILPATSWSCIDIHELPADKKDDPQWQKYRTFDGENIPFEDDTFNVVLFSDVLHHTDGRSELLLKEAGRTGALVIVKDHFEYSLYSRAILLAMDFVGNWGYGIKLPKRYFDQKTFSKIINNAELTCKQLDIGINLYNHLPIIKHILNPKWQFIAELNKKVN